MKFATRICLIAAVLLSATSLALARDKRLAGNWQGQRDEAGKCSFMAWTMTRSPDGKFEITFYKNPRKTQLAGREIGRWETKGDKLSLFTNGVATPEVYTYTFTDNDTVHLSNIKRDASADCMADYEFTDHRVKP